MRVLVTGASGYIGQPVCTELRARGDWVRGFDRTLQVGAVCDEFVLGDLTDPYRVAEAVRGVDAIVHLGAVPDEAPFEQLVGPNVSGVFHILDAARSNNVRRVLLASSVQAASGAPGERRADTRAPVNHYAVTKLFAEDLGEFYARKFGLEVTAARIGWMVRNPLEARRIVELNLTGWYISRGDVSRFVHTVVHASFSGYRVVYVVGAGSAGHFDMEPAERLFGFRPAHRFPEGLPFEAE
ncbi:MAG: NAD(P)-dependent oxidoreductase [Myxococcota bacterium]|jgi:uronate dehydrogenase|nr:NAD(P)-dependent oxidoreductase [Myxococcota bacterium]